jgi:hypothetical protein
VKYVEVDEIKVKSQLSHKHFIAVESRMQIVALHRKSSNEDLLTRLKVFFIELNITRALVETNLL